MRNRRKSLTTVNPLKGPLNSAFRILRKQGVFAKQNFSCCQSCAWAEISSMPVVPENIVFYHRQDGQDLTRRGRVYLAWSGDGEGICEVLKSQGLKVEWNGSKDSRILVDINK
jgi:hypothetical protein